MSKLCWCYVIFMWVLLGAIAIGGLVKFVEVVIWVIKAVVG